MKERVADLLRRRYREQERFDTGHQERAVENVLRPRTGLVMPAPRGLFASDRFSNRARADEVRRAHDNDQ